MFIQNHSIDWQLYFFKVDLVYLFKNMYFFILFLCFLPERLQYHAIY